MPRGLVALFISTSSKIGQTILQRFAQNAPIPKIYTITCTPTISSYEALLAFLRYSYPSDIYNLVKADVSLISEIDKILRVLLSLRFLGNKILVLRLILNQFLDLTGATAANENQARWLCSSGAVLLADLVSTCSDVFHISKSILAASRNEQNLLGAWWFSCYYTFNAALAILGVLLVRRIYPFSAELAGSSVTELRSLLDTAMSVFAGPGLGEQDRLVVSEHPTPATRRV
ncbi:hypothetical protein NKR23_g5731 [Pleurostoma richardsiae]|uniref:Uncharacterized protein n=1 Tax=Pleurostoma richardsiae TaxID=41990 RepID=A0AA38RSF4_9PEZI|nr:hypothetical protein NKR23_g5731 [Pleurostoma richardsiae]